MSSVIPRVKRSEHAGHPYEGRPKLYAIWIILDPAKCRANLCIESGMSPIDKFLDRRMQPEIILLSVGDPR